MPKLELIELPFALYSADLQCVRLRTKRRENGSKNFDFVHQARYTSAKLRQMFQQ